MCRGACEEGPVVLILLTFQVLRIIDVNFLVQLERFLVIAHSTEAACHHKPPLHLWNVEGWMVGSLGGHDCSMVSLWGVLMLAQLRMHYLRRTSKSQHLRLCLTVGTVNP